MQLDFFLISWNKACRDQSCAPHVPPKWQYSSYLGLRCIEEVRNSGIEYTRLMIFLRISTTGTRGVQSILYFTCM